LVDANGNPAPTTPPGTKPKKGCFTGDTTVQLENGRDIPMRHLEVGDRVKVSSNKQNNKYETVYAFVKRDATVPDEYVKIGWNNSKSNKNSPNNFLELTPNHMLQVLQQGDAASSGNWKMIPASLVKLGDQLLLDSSDDSTKTTTTTTTVVTSIVRTGHTRGYGPLTFSGHIVANRIHASTYVSSQNTEHLQLGDSTTTTIVTGVTWQWLVQTVLLPIRWMGQVTAVWKLDVFSEMLAALSVERLSFLAETPAWVLAPFAAIVVAFLAVVSLAESIALALLANVPLVAFVCLVGMVLWRRGVTVRRIKHKAV